MTTPLIPLKSVLSGTRYTPAELTEDENFEDYLLGLTTGNNEGIRFIKAIMQAYRLGLPEVTFVWSSSTICDDVNDFLLIGPINYGYLITTSGTSMTVRWVPVV